MDIKLINVGYGNFISSSRIIAIIGPESAPVKRMIQEAREERRLIDATYGRRTRAVITQTGVEGKTAFHACIFLPHFSRNGTFLSFTQWCT